MDVALAGCPITVTHEDVVGETPTNDGGRWVAQDRMPGGRVAGRRMGGVGVDGSR